jgi:hypothetical protein
VFSVWDATFSLAASRIALISRADAVGLACLTRAATPHTCGELIDVPLAVKLPASLLAAGMTVLTPLAEMSGNVRDPIGPREENDAIARVLLETAATARPLAVAELPAVLLPELPADVQGTMLALRAAASIACWLTSVMFGLDPYDMLADTML